MSRRTVPENLTTDVTAETTQITGRVIRIQDRVLLYLPEYESSNLVRSRTHIWISDIRIGHVGPQAEVAGPCYLLSNGQIPRKDAEGVVVDERTRS